MTKLFKMIWKSLPQKRLELLKELKKQSGIKST